MANIADLLNNLMLAVYGKDVRKTIHDAIAAMNQESTHAGEVADILDEKLADGSLVGSRGPQGPQGPQGIQGIKGDKGLTGAQGIQGLKGDPGAQGIQGLKGEVGDKGDIGEQGIKGDAGIQGIQGVKGDTGDKGDRGEMGTKGADGTSVTILGEKSSVGELPQNAQRGDAYLIKGALYVWTDTEWVNAGSIQGPQGLQGEKGDRGDTGAKGADGNSVKIIGTVGSVAELPAEAEKGDGYIIAGRLHVWTGSVWSDVGNIQGPKGDKGDKGLTGDKGLKGDTGAQGIQGLKGDTGAAGQQGLKGDKGDKGDAYKSSIVVESCLLVKWLGDGVPYQNTITVAGVMERNNIEVLIDETTSVEAVHAWMEANILIGIQSINAITLRAYGEKPKIDIPLKFIIRGD